MHPRMFLDGFWRPEIRYQVFVAMPFGGAFDDRYRKIIEPAIANCQVKIKWREPGGKVEFHGLTPCRVDNSRSGDSILTEIMDGVAHSFLVLADLSEVGRWVNDAQEKKSTPNGNVMYEVGLALACRQQPEVILIRDKKDQGTLLFDVSTTPCTPIDFSDVDGAIKNIQALMLDRAAEIDYRKSHRIGTALASLTPNEIQIIDAQRNDVFFGWKNTGTVNFLVDSALPGLLQKGILRYGGVHEAEGMPFYTWTAFGAVIRDRVPLIRK